MYSFCCNETVAESHADVATSELLSALFEVLFAITGNVATLPVKGTDSCSDTPTKGYETTPARLQELSKLARNCHGFSSQHAA